MKTIRQWLIPTLLAVGMLFAASSQAVTFLSNLDTASDYIFTGGPDSADRFTTGTQPLVVTHITVRWFNGNSGVANQVGIYTEEAGFPSTTRVGSFFANSAPTMPGVMTYTGNVSLAANTTYWLVVDITDGSLVAATSDERFSADPGTGGAVMLTGSAYGNSLTPGSWRADPSNLQYALGDGSDPSVPTLSEWGLLLLAGLIGATTLLMQRRSRRSV